MVSQSDLDELLIYPTINPHDTTYNKILQDVFDNGVKSDDRTGTGTISTFGGEYTFNLKQGFPLITTKKVHWKSVVGELLWFLSGSTNANELEQKYGVTIWKEWADKNGELGPVYGKQWRCWESVTINPIKIFDKPDQSNIKGTVQNIGILGDNEKYYGDPLYKELYQTWYGMLKRCYNTDHQAYDSYGGKGVFVDNNWLTFSKFYEDALKLPNWHLKMEYPEKFTLDKDFYSSNKYGPDTCIWSEIISQSVNTSNNSNFLKITDKNNNESFHYGLKPLARLLKRSATALSFALKNNTLCEGNKIEKLTIPENQIVRYIKTDQILDVIAQIKHNPNSRRIIVNAWNTNELSKMKLSPCHAFFQFYVRNNELSCKLTQRSADAFLGVPFNIASYALLTHMIAQVCGLGVDKLIMSFGDLHIYNNHMDQVKEQLSRSFYVAPSLKLNQDVKDIDSFKVSDIVLENYNSHPTIKAKVAI